MQRRFHLTLAAIPLIIGLAPAAAQSFINLNFESAIPNGSLGYDLPGWAPSSAADSPHIGESPQFYLASASPSWNTPPLSGNYSLAMAVGALYNDDLTQVEIVEPVLSQTALIPASARSIHIRATSPDAYHFHDRFGPPPNIPDVYSQGLLLAWRLEINGQAHPLYRLGNDLWGMNIPGLGGQVGALSISMNQNYKLTGLERPTGVFDDISFSSLRIIPEPTSLALTVIAGLALANRRRSQ